MASAVVAPWMLKQVQHDDFVVRRLALADF